MLRAETISDVGRLRECASEWSELADASEAPYSLPGWGLAWWEHLRPEGAQLRTVLVWEGDRLAGVAPFFAERDRYRLLATELSEPVQPLAVPGRENEVGGAVARELDREEVRPRLIDLGTQWTANDWGSRLGNAWPGGRKAWTREGATIPVLLTETDGLDLDAWLRRRSSKLRNNLRRSRRRIEEAGARFRLADVDSVEEDVSALLALHLKRHADEATPLARPGVAAMLTAAGCELIPRGSFRLFCIDLDGCVVAAHLMLVAGGRVTGWNSGFDDAYAKFSPALNSYAESVSLAAERGDHSIDLGPDTAPHKRRLADDESTLTARVVVPPGRGALRTRAWLALKRGAS